MDAQVGGDIAYVKPHAFIDDLTSHGCALADEVYEDRDNGNNIACRDVCKNFRRKNTHACEKKRGIRASSYETPHVADMPRGGITLDAPFSPGGPQRERRNIPRPAVGLDQGFQRKVGEHIPIVD